MTRGISPCDRLRSCGALRIMDPPRGRGRSGLRSRHHGNDGATASRYALAAFLGFAQRRKNPTMSLTGASSPPPAPGREARRRARDRYRRCRRPAASSRRRSVELRHRDVDQRRLEGRELAAAGAHRAPSGCRRARHRCRRLSASGRLSGPFPRSATAPDRSWPCGPSGRWRRRRRRD